MGHSVWKGLKRVKTGPKWPKKVCLNLPKGLLHTGSGFYEVPTPHPLVLSVEPVFGWLATIRNPRDFNLQATVYPGPCKTALGFMNLANRESGYRLFKIALSFTNLAKRASGSRDCRVSCSDHAENQTKDLWVVRAMR